jgi:hypothetical protein
MKPPSIAARVQEQTYAAQKALIDNQITAIQYQAMAEGNRKVLDWLKSEFNPTPAVEQIAAPAPVKGDRKLHAA